MAASLRKPQALIEGDAAGRCALTRGSSRSNKAPRDRLPPEPVNHSTGVESLPAGVERAEAASVGGAQDELVDRNRLIDGRVQGDDDGWSAHSHALSDAFFEPQDGGAEDEQTEREQHENLRPKILDADAFDDDAAHDRQEVS
jgi:hypothetical protein